MSRNDPITRDATATPSGTPPWLPAALLVAATSVLIWVVLRLHTTPSYGSETDLIGDLIPAARALRSGKLIAENFLFKGPGYPAILAVIGGAMGGDDWLAARWLNVLSAVVGAWFAFRIASRFLSGWAAVFVMLGLFASPAWLRAAVESGSDMPAFAIAIVTTWIVLSQSTRSAWLIAGALAGIAYLTRYNTVAVVPAAVVTAFAASRGPRDGAGEHVAPSPMWLIACYAAAFGAIVGGWTIVGGALATGVLQNRNYLNNAFEFYGRGMLWDNYWTTAAQRFHSFYDVLHFDPSRAALAVARNAGTHWWSDIREVLPLWLGIPAVLGMLAAWPRRRGALAVGAHFLFAYLVLTSVFYAARFSLYLAPFYLMGVAALLFHTPQWPWRGRVPHRLRVLRSKLATGSTKRKGGGAIAAPAKAPRPSPLLVQELRWALGALLLLTSGWVAARGVRTMLASAPFETRDAGRALRRFATPGARLMARKPHAAFFAGMEYVPVPQVESLSELIDFATAQHTGYLMFTGLEATMRGQFLLLADSGVVVPGLAQIARRTYPKGHFYNLYRFTGEPIEPDGFARALIERAAVYASRNPRNPLIQSYVGRLLFDYGLPNEALRFLEQSIQLDPASAQTAGLMAFCAFETGHDARAAEAAEHAISVAPVNASVHAIVGVARASEARWAEAQQVFQQASALEPTEPRPLLQLALAAFVAGDAPTARRALDRSVELAPELAEFRERASAAFGTGAHADLALALIHRIMHSSIYGSDLRELTQAWGA